MIDLSQIPHGRNMTGDSHFVFLSRISGDRLSFDNVKDYTHHMEVEMYTYVT